MTKQSSYVDRPSVSWGALAMTVGTGVLFFLITSITLTNPYAPNIGRDLAVFAGIWLVATVTRALITFSVTYEIRDQNLRFRTWPCVCTIPLSQIRSATPASGWKVATSGWATRLRHGVKVDAGRFKTIYITPNDPGRFLAEIANARARSTQDTAPPDSAATPSS